MKYFIEKMIYETPIVEVIEVEIEKGFATSSSNLENPEEDFPGSWN